MKKEPFSATIVTMYFISLILMYRVIISSKIKEKPWQQQDKQIQSFRVPTATNPVGGELQGLGMEIVGIQFLF